MKEEFARRRRLQHKTRRTSKARAMTTGTRIAGRRGTKSLSSSLGCAPLADGDGCGIDTERETEDVDEEDEEDKDIELDSGVTSEEAVGSVEDMANPDDTAEVAVAPVATGGTVAEFRVVDESAEGSGNSGPVVNVGADDAALIASEVATDSMGSVAASVEVVEAVDSAVGRLGSDVGVGSSAGLVDPPYTHPVPRGIEGP